CQLRRAEEAYFGPARTTAQRLGLTTELGIALCFDIHVQNGGLKSEAREIVDSARTTQTTEAQLRAIVANAVADVSASRWRSDVRERKLAIATGHGSVHGEQLVLESWGLGEYPS